jgi:hypothetical protein
MKPYADRSETNTARAHHTDRAAYSGSMVQVRP